MYDPDRMPNRVCGDLSIDHRDRPIPWMNHAIWADDINDSHVGVLKARYYGEITSADESLGRILDVVDAREIGRHYAHLFFLIAEVTRVTIGLAEGLLRRMFGKLIYPYVDSKVLCEKYTVVYVVNWIGRSR
jgi:hypothetical protein